MALLPLGVEASWRLSRWDKLDVMLSRVDTVQRSIDRDFLEVGHLSTSIATPGSISTPVGVISPHTPLSTSALGVLKLDSDVSIGQDVAPRAFTLQPEDLFSVNLGRLFQHLAHGQGEKFSSCLKQTRLNTCMPLVQPAWSPMIAHTPC